MLRDLHVSALRAHIDSSVVLVLNGESRGVVMLGDATFHLFAVPTHCASIGNDESASWETFRRLASGTLFIGETQYVVVKSSEWEVPMRPSFTCECELTPRERDIVLLVADGHGNKSIAVALGIAASTVATHLRRIYAKLCVTTRAAMVHRCLHVLGAAGEHQRRRPPIGSR